MVTKFQALGYPSMLSSSFTWKRREICSSSTEFELAVSAFVQIVCPSYVASIRETNIGNVISNHTIIKVFLVPPARWKQKWRRVHCPPTRKIMSPRRFSTRCELVSILSATFPHVFPANLLRCAKFRCRSSFPHATVLFLKLFVMYSAIWLWHIAGAIYTCVMILLTLETLILWISFANATLRYACLHKQSTLLHK